MKQALEAYTKEERHRTVAETRYWCAQYRLLAEQAIAAIAEAERQEPVAWINWSALTGERRLGWGCESEIASEPLYTAPPQRQPLTRKDVLAIIDSEPAYMTTGLPMFYRDQVAIIVRKVERKHGIGGGE